VALQVKFKVAPSQLSWLVLVSIMEMLGQSASGTDNCESDMVEPAGITTFIVGVGLGTKA
jgi:hypothetical protein